MGHEVDNSESEASEHEAGQMSGKKAKKVCKSVLWLFLIACRSLID